MTDTVEEAKAAFESLAKQAAPVKAVSDLSFSIRTGEAFGLANSWASVLTR